MWSNGVIYLIITSDDVQSDLLAEDTRYAAAFKKVYSYTLAQSTVITAIAHLMLCALH